MRGCEGRCELGAVWGGAKSGRAVDSTAPTKRAALKDWVVRRPHRRSDEREGHAGKGAKLH